MKIYFDKPMINNIQVTVNFPHYRTYQNILSRCLTQNIKDIMIMEVEA